MSKARRARISIETRERLIANPQVHTAEANGFALYCVLDFLSDLECSTLKDVINRDLFPSGLMLRKGATNDGFRTSQSCNLERFDPFIFRIDARICELMGMRPEQGETLQGQVYQVGELFKPHYDWFDMEAEYWPEQRFCGEQRTWTAMIYLDEPQAGGATHFVNAGCQVAPMKGMILIWNNMDDEGNPNTLSLHEGQAIKRGHKTVVTKWFREGDWLQY
jgi:prolyl 4-hydroxylase